MILEGNTIEYEITDDTVTVTITDEDGNVTQISVPVNSFTF
jgi:outer membrane usher protein FimD/PapC